MATVDDDNFDDESFLQKAKRFARMVPFAEDAVAAYYAMKDSKTPISHRVAIAGALVYFVSPIDGIPDAIPVAGYTDDAGVFAVALALVSNSITGEHRDLAIKFFEE